MEDFFIKNDTPQYNFQKKEKNIYFPKKKPKTDLPTFFNR